jgi:hypothetical protein
LPSAPPDGPMLLLPHQATAPRSPFHLGARCGGTPHHHVDAWAGGAPPRHTLPLLTSRRRPDSATHVISTGHHEDAGPLLLAAPCPTRAASLFFTSRWTQTPFLLVSMWRAARDAVPLPLCFGAALTWRPVHRHGQHCGLVARLSTCRGPWRLLHACPAGRVGPSWRPIDSQRGGEAARSVLFTSA